MPTPNEPADVPQEQRIDESEILQRFQALINEDLSEEDIEARLKTDFTDEEQKMLTDTVLNMIVSSESERHFNV